METNNEKDKVIVCRNCGEEFIWTEGEQEFYLSNYLQAPVRCKACRDKRKAERNNQERHEEN